MRSLSGLENVENKGDPPPKKKGGELILGKGTGVPHLPLFGRGNERSILVEPEPHVDQIGGNHKGEKVGFGVD